MPDRTTSAAGATTAPRSGAAPAGVRLDAGDDAGVWATLKAGVQVSPQLISGWPITLLLATVMTLGRILIPIAVQQTIDHGLTDNGVDVGFVVEMALVCLAGIVITGLASYASTMRLVRNAEHGLASLRLQAFRHVHELPVLTQNTERRGGLVSRVTGDVDQVSQFLQFGGLIFLVSVGQMIVATIVMFVYSPILALVVLVCFVPLIAAAPALQKKMTVAYGKVRARVADALSAISEPVVGAEVVRTYGIGRRTQDRIDHTVDAWRDQQTKAQVVTAITFSIGGLGAGLANAGVLVTGVLLGVNGQVSAGTVIAFMFLVSLFADPVQIATQVLADAQQAIAGWRRVLGVIATPADVADPGEAGEVLPRGPASVRFDGVQYAYPGGEPVLRDVTVSIAPGARIAVVGETGSGKTTFAKLLCRLMDPVAGRIELDDIALRDIRFSSLRERVVLVPQEGFLFDGTIAANVAFGHDHLGRHEIEAAATELGLDDWLAGLDQGLDTEVGQRGESLSAGERQLVALLRAYLADPDLLVLDEATSAVDPGTETRINAALERLMRGRTSVTIAHRLSSAEAADEVLVFDAGRLVQRGPHAHVVSEPGVYAGLYASWIAHRDHV